MSEAGGENSAAKVSLAHRLEYAGLLVFVFLMRLLGWRAASAFGGWLGRVIGMRLGVTNKARRNIAMALPEKSPEEVEQILRGMWDNLGRVAAEFPFIEGLDFSGTDPRITLYGEEIMERIIASDRPSILFSGHIGNWEVCPRSLGQRGVEPGIVYRAPNNPLVDEMIQGFRGKNSGHLVPKGARGARELLRLIRKNVSIAMLVDQKMNDGIAVPFFGREAMTAPAAAQIALKQDLDLVPVRCVRRKGMQFEVHFCPPFRLEKTGDMHADVFNGMARINRQLEEWIREHPAQWMWVHSRWPKDQAGS